MVISYFIFQKMWTSSYRVNTLSAWPACGFTPERNRKSSCVLPVGSMWLFRWRASMHCQPTSSCRHFSSQSQQQALMAEVATCPKMTAALHSGRLVKQTRRLLMFASVARAAHRMTRRVLIVIEWVVESFPFDCSNKYIYFKIHPVLF